MMKLLVLARLLVVVIVEHCSLSRASLDVKDGALGSIERHMSDFLFVKKRAKAAKIVAHAQKKGCHISQESFSKS